MSLLDDLLGAGAGAVGQVGSALGLGGGAPPASAAPTPYSGLLPSHLNLPPATTDDSTDVAPVAVKGKKSVGYDNSEDLAAIQQAQAKDASVAPTNSGAGTGLVNMIPNSLPGAGTLRNVLGTLGDAFLIQAGHQPAYAAQQYRQQIANAAAGMDTNPQAAIGRLYASSAPGAQQEASTANNAYQTQQLRQSEQESLNNWRQGNQQIASDREAAVAAAKRNTMEAGYGSVLQGRLAAAAAAAKTDPSKWQAATAWAKKYASEAAPDGKPRLPNFDAESDAPDKVDDYVNGQGLTASQFARNQTSQDSIAERGNAAAARNATTQRGQNLAAGSAANRTSNTPTALDRQIIQKQNSGVSLTKAEQQYWDKRTNIPKKGGGLNIPGLTPSTGQAGQYQDGVIYVNPRGDKALYSKGKWIPQ